MSSKSPAAEEQATVKSLEEMVAKDPDDKYAPSALRRHQDLAKNLDSRRKKWDLVVLQSYRDDLEGDKSLYAQYAPKFAELIKAIVALAGQTTSTSRQTASAYSA